MPLWSHRHIYACADDLSTPQLASTVRGVLGRHRCLVVGAREDAIADDRLPNLEPRTGEKSACLIASAY